MGPPPASQGTNSNRTRRDSPSLDGRRIFSAPSPGWNHGTNTRLNHDRMVDEIEDELQAPPPPPPVYSSQQTHVFTPQQSPVYTPQQTRMYTSQQTPVYTPQQVYPPQVIQKQSSSDSVTYPHSMYSNQYQQEKDQFEQRQMIQAVLAKQEKGTLNRSPVRMRRDMSPDAYGSGTNSVQNSPPPVYTFDMPDIPQDQIHQHRSPPPQFNDPGSPEDEITERFMRNFNIHGTHGWISKNIRLVGRSDPYRSLSTSSFPSPIQKLYHASKISFLDVPHRLTHNPIFIFDKHSNVLGVNEQAQDILGLMPGQKFSAKGELENPGNKWPTNLLQLHVEEFADFPFALKRKYLYQIAKRLGGKKFHMPCVLFHAKEGKPIIGVLSSWMYQDFEVLTFHDYQWVPGNPQQQLKIIQDRIDSSERLIVLACLELGIHVEERIQKLFPDIFLQGR